MPTIRYLPDDYVVNATPGETVFAAALRSQIAIPTACVGKGTCGLCRIKILSDDASLNAITDAEKTHLGNVYFLTRIRLSCQTLVGDEAIAVEIVRKRARR